MPLVPDRYLHQARMRKLEKRLRVFAKGALAHWTCQTRGCSMLSYAVDMPGACKVCGCVNWKRVDPPKEKQP